MDPAIQSWLIRLKFVPGSRPEFLKQFFANVRFTCLLPNWYWYGTVSIGIFGPLQALSRLLKQSRGPSDTLT
jgi:hypothetical protein